MQYQVTLTLVKVTSELIILTGSKLVISTQYQMTLTPTKVMILKLMNQCLLSNVQKKFTNIQIKNKIKKRNVYAIFNIISM